MDGDLEDSFAAWRARQQPNPAPLPGPSRTVAFETPQPIGLGLRSTHIPEHLPENDPNISTEASFAEGASGPQPESVNMSSANLTTARSDSSSFFEAETDPVAWARRLDEIAGIMEMTETEERALRCGPLMQKGVVPGRGQPGKRVAFALATSAKA